MFISKKLLFLCAGLTLTAGCTDTISGQLNFVEPLERTSKIELPNTSITLDGTKYEVRRTSITSYNNKTGEKVGEREVWSIVDSDGKVLKCIRANADSCQLALEGETRQEMGDY